METADQKTDLLKTTVTAFRDRRGKADWVSINEDGGYELGADPCQDKDVCKRIVEFLVKSIRASEVGHVCTLIMKMQRIHVYVQDPRFDKLVPWLRFMFQSCLDRKMPIVVPKKVRILTLLVFIWCMTSVMPLCPCIKIRLRWHAHNQGRHDKLICNSSTSHLRSYGSNKIPLLVVESVLKVESHMFEQ